MQVDGLPKILAGETLFRQGDPGDHFYVIIVGCVSVHIQDAQTGEDHEVAVLRNGDSFGELALMQEGNLRAASIIAKDDSEFLTIFRDDYSRILGAVSEHELADKVNLLRGLPAFRNVPHSMVRSVAYVMSTRDYARNALVLRQGDEVEGVYFVERGGVRLVREVEDRAALRALRVDEDGPGAALRGAAREGFAAEPPQKPRAWGRSRRTSTRSLNISGRGRTSTERPGARRVRAGSLARRGRFRGGG